MIVKMRIFSLLTILMIYANLMCWMKQLWLLLAGNPPRNTLAREREWVFAISFLQNRIDIPSMPQTTHS